MMSQSQALLTFHNKLIHFRLAVLSILSQLYIYYSSSFIIYIYIHTLYTHIIYMYIKDNTILVYRLAIWLICAFLRMVWGGGRGEGYSLSVRASTVDTLS